MQITRAEVTPVELSLRRPVHMAGLAEITSLTAIFVRIETRQGHNAWGCTVAHPTLTGETPENALHTCHECSVLLPDLHPTNIEYSLAELSRRIHISPAVMCAFDLAFHDLLGLAASMPLYRILGGYRNCIQTSVTIPITSIEESVEIANAHARVGFRIFKIKGGLNPEEDVRRVQAIHKALPDHTLRLDADGGYSVQEALAVAHALEEELEMLEQPTSPADLPGLRHVTRLSRIPVLADQSLHGPASALELASNHIADGLVVKLVRCGGLNNACQIDAIANAAHLATMVGCVIEPALLVSAGLSFALSRPNVRYGDLDGYLDLTNDPSHPGFRLEEGWLVASEAPGLGYSVEL
jgi:L-alanine-DL-glutamate epimerase-like enolase superfamily enzyme